MEVKKCNCEYGEFKVSAYLKDKNKTFYHVASCDCCGNTIRYTGINGNYKRYSK